MADKRPLGRPQNRACEACRALKIRCLAGIPGPGPECQRCVRSGLKCVFVKPQRRTQRKRNEARIIELEKEMAAMRALLGQNIRGFEGFSNMQTPPSTNSPTSSHVITAPTPSHTAILQQTSDYDIKSLGSYQAQVQPDVVDRGVLTMEAAEELFETFKSKCITKFPALNIPETYTVTTLRQNHRVLFLAVMAAAAGMADPELYSNLNAEAIQEYANASMVRGEKTLELVQAMTTSVMWYFPMGSWSQMKFYEYIHYASTMATDLGLGDDGLIHKGTPGLVGELEVTGRTETKHATPISSAIDIENSRAWLLCYFNCAS